MSVLGKRVAAAAVVALGLSCASERAEQAPPPPLTESGPVSKAIDVSALTSRARHAFRPASDGSLTTGARGHAVAVDPSGTLHFVPRAGRNRQGSALSLLTTSLGRGGWVDASTSRSAPRLERDGSVRIVRGSVVEHLQSDAAGVEQSWELAGKPSGDGDLVVRVSASGYALHADGSGVRFTDGSGSAVRYGSARWVDARGETSDVSIRVEGSEIVLVVPRDVVDRSAYPAVLDPTITAEMALDAPVIGFSGVPLNFVKVAPGKNGTFFVVWMDERVPRPLFNGFGDTQIYGARIAADGTVLDPTGIVIAQSNEQEQDSPVVTFDGTDTWLVAWGQYSFTESDCEIYSATRVSDTGALLDPQGIRFGCLFGAFGVGFDGTSFHVTGAAGASLYGWKVPKSGSPGALVPTTLVAKFGSNAVDVTCDNKTTCLVAWRSNGAVRASRLGQNGLADPLGVQLGSNPSSVTATYDGTNFVVGWVDGNALLATRVSPATGAALDGTGVTVATGVTSASAASDGQNSLFVWDVFGSLRGARLSKLGVALDASTIPITASAFARDHDVAGGPGGYLAAWIDDSVYSARKLFVDRISPAGVALDGDGIAIHKSANREHRPVAARSTTGYLTVWEDFRDGAKPSLYYARLSDVGTPLDTPAKLLSLDARNASVASDGTDYLVFWESASGLAFARIAAASGALTAGPSAFGPAGRGMPDLIHDGTRYLLAWTEGASTKVTRLDSAGIVLDASPLELAQFDAEARGAFDGQGYLYTLGAGEIFGRRIASNWTLPEAAPFAISTTNISDDMQSVAFDGQSYVVAWRRALQDDPPRGDILAARVSPAGVVLDTAPIAVEISQVPAVFPHVVAMQDGIGSLVLWSDSRRTDRTMDFDVYAAAIRRDGVVLDPKGFVVSGESGNELFPFAVNAGPGRALVAYQRMDGSTGFGQERVRVRFVSTGKVANAACTTSAECASRFCADGFCCDRACDGACETCAKTPGTCTPVASADDADTCGGDRTCTADAKCLSKRGGPCASTPDCLDGTCSDGVCCDRACDGTCETCVATLGTCTPKPARSIAEGRCAPYACDGKSATCPTECTSDEQCPPSGRCDVATKTCVEGAICVDSRTLTTPGQGSVSCAPYVCELAACRTTCRSVADCVFPAVCGENGTCDVPGPAAIGGGCAASPGSPSSGAAWLFVLLALTARGARASRASRDRRASR